MTMTVTMKAAARPPSVERRGRRARRYTELPDPPKKIDMAQHKHIVRAHSILEDRYANDPTTLVIGEVYLRMTAGDQSGFTVPDCLVAFDVDAAEIDDANGYVIDEAGKPPDVVIEVASKTTGVRDYTIKRRIYRDMGAPEYWRFDDTGGQYHDEPLAGDILADGEYRRAPIRVDPDGTFWGYSPALALFLVWDDGRLRFYDPAVRDFLPDLSESKRQTAAERAARIMSERRADMSDRRADRADRRANAERAERIMSERRAAASERRADEADRRADESERRAAEAEAELERLRGLLGGL